MKKPVKPTIAAAVGFATPARGDAARAEGEALDKVVAAAKAEGIALDSEEMRLRVTMTPRGRRRKSAASTEGVAKDDEGMKTIRAGVRARERQRHRRLKGTSANSKNAAARHARFQALFDELRRKHPNKKAWSEHRIQEAVADRFGVSVHTVRRVTHDC
jgi:transposase